jgi:hypothetical protein
MPAIYLLNLLANIILARFITPPPRGGTSELGYEISYTIKMFGIELISFNLSISALSGSLANQDLFFD